MTLQETINTWIVKNKLTPRISILLLESYRRFNKFNDNKKPLNQVWVGLGTKTEYNNSYFKPITCHNPKYTAWYGLTEKGVKVVQDLLDTLPWKEKYNESIYSGNIEQL